jgi:pimeloyl-ACP methyl ester carboxylesterase
MTRCALAPTAALFCLVAPLLGAQPSPCNALASKAPAGVTWKTESVAADAAASSGPGGGQRLASHCRVTGRMAERVGADGKSYSIGFELRLPDDWNGRLLYQGGGGNDGVIRPAVGSQATREPALNQGFAVVSTDAGHQGATAEFGFDPIARIDNAYNAHDRVAVLAKDVVGLYYARPAHHAYFVGCSGGGRQGMMFTQRFPSYFDGVLAMAPAMRVSKGATVAVAWDTQALLAVAPAGADGRPVLSRALSDADLALLRRAILDTCDDGDGVADGLVSNPAACRFDVRTLQCRQAGTGGCLTAAQVGALERIMGGARDSRGNALYFGWPWDPGIGHPRNDWRAWKLGTSATSQPNSMNVMLMQDALQGYFVTPPDRSLTLLSFDFDRDPQRMDAYAWVFNTADDARLTAFKARGGRLLIAHGLADPIFSAYESIDYVERLGAEYGEGAADFARLFLVPGMGHCQGGAATDGFDGLGALVDWVELGRAPQSIMASGTTVFPNRTRPLCPYPQYARYAGSGDPEDGRNFVCRSSGGER